MNPHPHNPDRPEHPERPPASSLPDAPFILLDTFTAAQAATALTRIEAWLLTGDPVATTECAHACSSGEDDAAAIAGWVGTLADRLRHRVEETNSWSSGQGS